MTDNLKILRKNLSGVNMSLNGAMTIDLRSDIHDKVSDIKNKVEELIEEINEIVDKENYKYYKFHIIINGSEHGYLYFYTDADINAFEDTDEFIEFIKNNDIIDRYYISYLYTIEVITESEYKAIYEEYSMNHPENILMRPNGSLYKFSVSIIKVIRASNDFREVKD